ncbi:PREDICTED: succinate dehydrogenase [ubiquinone] cytochrome b small subunit, mitochondrial isoform X2 [Calidris pugnax]|uniref:succinate dehydrogenase [ubiquinone] cytochrome b small subunit, mitochondrial isoform X2 n=1 Tax=Calidris pugnax TaxID=198806 RepID=UPI00071C670C|nr:PREDICTED: succinate dehydrogenase [ubiquinone] cytochrome b small subunit, mitochondrial isoform X2 [Calidris pugnax]
MAATSLLVSRAITTQLLHLHHRKCSRRRLLLIASLGQRFFSSKRAWIRCGHCCGAVVLWILRYDLTPPKQRCCCPETPSCSRCWLGGGPEVASAGSGRRRLCQRPPFRHPAAIPEAEGLGRHRLPVPVRGALGRLGTMAAFVLLRAGLARPRGAQMALLGRTLGRRPAVLAAVADRSAPARQTHSSPQQGHGVLDRL